MFGPFERMVAGRYLRARKGERFVSIIAIFSLVGIALGVATLIVVVAPSHYSLGASGSFTVGIGVTAYTLGMRHAFDADHISAIDNTTRKLMGEGKRPLSVGFWFSLGHSSVVFGLAFLLAIGVKALVGPVQDGDSERAGRWAGTVKKECGLHVLEHKDGSGI